MTVRRYQLTSSACSRPPHTNLGREPTHTSEARVRSNTPFALSRVSLAWHLSGLYLAFAPYWYLGIAFHLRDSEVGRTALARPQATRPTAGTAFRSWSRARNTGPACMYVDSVIQGKVVAYFCKRFLFCNFSPFWGRRNLLCYLRRITEITLPRHKYMYFGRTSRVIISIGKANIGCQAKRRKGNQPLNEASAAN